MPRSKQLIAAFAAFWLVYACAAVFEWTVAGPANGTSRMAAAVGMEWVVADDARAAAGSLAGPAPRAG